MVYNHQFYIILSIIKNVKAFIVKSMVRAQKKMKFNQSFHLFSHNDFLKIILDHKSIIDFKSLILFTKVLYIDSVRKVFPSSFTYSKDAYRAFPGLFRYSD
jgi:hypothetical protein